jgi:hypothetical protein
MNNYSPIKLINQNGGAREYGTIPDLWHIAQHLKSDPGERGQAMAEAVLQVWHMAHDLKACIEGQGQAHIVSPKVTP